MRIQFRKIISLEKKIFFFSCLLIVLNNCQSLHNIEVIVENRSLNAWSLSPEGDKILYQTHAATMLLFPQTSQEYEVGCDLIGWLDNSTLLCTRGEKRAMLLIDNSFEEIPLKQVDASEISLKAILSDQRNMYQPEWRSDTIYVFDASNRHDPEKNFVVTNIKDLTTFLAGSNYSPIILSRPFVSLRGRVFSPDRSYFLSTDGTKLEIYEAKSNKLLADFIAGEAQALSVRGWASDSSGVYFQTNGLGFAEASAPREIKKLLVPK